MVNRHLIQIKFIINYFYQIICLNFSFLVVNCLFFQIYFIFDFKAAFLPLYLLVSITILPSITALVRVGKAIKLNQEGSFFKIIFQNLLTAFKKEVLISLGSCLIVYLIIFNLYLIKVNSVWTLLLYASNLSLLIMIFVFLMNFIFLSINYSGKGLFKMSLKTFLKTFTFNLLVILLGIILVIVILKLWYMSRLVIFGCVLKLISTIALKRNRRIVEV